VGGAAAFLGVYGVASSGHCLIIRKEALEKRGAAQREIYRDVALGYGKGKILRGKAEGDSRLFSLREREREGDLIEGRQEDQRIR